MSSSVLGQYLWHELLTTDPAGGTGFYGKVFGWKQLPYEGEPGYTLLGNAQGPVGGVRVVGKDPLAGKAGPNWLTYVGVSDIAAALATTEAKGGKVLHPVTALAGMGGRYAVIADPQGAVIGLFEPPTGAGNGPMASPVSWHELTAEDPEAALEFYKTLFGWELITIHPMGGEVGNYYLFGQGTTQRGGIYRRASHLPASWPRWLVYISVPGVLAAVEVVKAAGGKLLNGPNEVPGGSWIAQVTDPHGLALALNGPKEAAATAPKAVAKPKAKAKVKAKSKPAVVKVKVKTKTKTKAKAPVKAKAKTKTKAKPKRKVAKTKVKAKAKSRAKTKVAPKAKSKPKGKKRSPARKAPRRGK